MPTHDLTFLDLPGDLPRCRRCGREITAEQWADDEPCEGEQE